LALLAAPSAASAATITVANTSDSGPGSLRQVISDANLNDTVVVPAGTYTLSSGEITIFGEINRPRRRRPQDGRAQRRRQPRVHGERDGDGEDLRPHHHGRRLRR